MYDVAQIHAPLSVDHIGLNLNVEFQNPYKSGLNSKHIRQKHREKHWLNRLFVISEARETDGLLLLLAHVIS